MSGVIDTDEFSERLRKRAVKCDARQLLVARIGESEQARDLTKPANCGGYGRIRHFTRNHGADWPRNPLPIDPASRALGLAPDDALQAQVFQNAACNWRCWYCYVPFSLLDAKEAHGGWLTAEELLSLYVQEPPEARPQMIDLSGGQPDLVPEWVPWMMAAMRARGLEGQVYLWSDDNLSNDYFWRFLSDEQRELVAGFKGYGRVACFKGVDEESFAFNTDAAPELFFRQFTLFRQLLSTGMDLYAYVTLTTPNATAINASISRLVDRLQQIHVNLPLRTVPLRVGVWGVVKNRLASYPEGRSARCALAEKNQLLAVEAWMRELEARFSSSERAMPIVDVPMRLA
jgi:uncharacterized Fe-S cluster-containing radical SAM superfamily protein